MVTFVGWYIMTSDHIIINAGGLYQLRLRVDRVLVPVGGFV
jgi:hypothetical protein